MNRTRCKNLLPYRWFGEKLLFSLSKRLYRKAELKMSSSRGITKASKPTSCMHSILFTIAYYNSWKLSSIRHLRCCNICWIRQILQTLPSLFLNLCFLPPKLLHPLTYWISFPSIPISHIFRFGPKRRGKLITGCHHNLATHQTK